MSQQLLGSVNLTVLKNGKLLLGRRQNTGWMDGYLWPFGGHILPGETPRVAMVREIEEELGVELRLEDLEFLCVAARKSGGKEYVAYEFIIREKPYEFINNEPHKCSELIWVHLKDLPEDTVPDYREIVTASLINNQAYLEIGYA